MQDTIGSINRLVAGLGDGLHTLNESLKAVNAGALNEGLLLVSYIVALRDLLLKKGLITPEEAIAMAEIADLEHLRERSPDTDGDSETPGGARQ